MKNNAYKAGAALALSLVAATAGAATGARAYIVQLADEPVASYHGGVAGLAATLPAEGHRLDARAAAPRAYAGYLHKKQDAVIAAIGAKKVLHRYALVVNGFSAVLTEAQVSALRGMKGVRHVSPDEPRQVVTNYTPHFIGLDLPGGLWSQRAQGTDDRGEGIVIGMVDTGVQPEDPSFFDRTANDQWVASGGTLRYDPAPAKFSGSCAAVPGFHCNNKLVGAQYFNANYNFVIDDAGLGWSRAPDEYLDSPRDSQGHGSHTSSTSGGNRGAVGVVANGALVGQISGVAPRARIATYKACWSYLDATGTHKNSCFTGDTTAAIEQAVADGVDIISYSIGGTLDNFLDPVEVAFFNASAAGVFVAAAAGNEGPGNTLNHVSPWLTTVAASTHDRLFFADATTGAGPVYSGASQSLGLASTPLMLSTDAGLAGQTADNVRLCVLGSLDATKVAGKVVVCDRGSNARTDKSLEVHNKGGVGMLLTNAPSTLFGGGSNTLNDDAHAVPTIHLSVTDRDAVRAYAATAGATVAFGTHYQAPGVIAPTMADFSSRGPDGASASILKPDVAAPGVNVWAAVAYLPPSQAVHDAIAAGTTAPPPVVDLYSGTSMATPHVAGIAALLKQLHPGWSPGAIKSAIMTSAGPLLTPTGAIDPQVFGYGAGQVRPNGAGDPGLVYPMREFAYDKFLCGVGALAADDPDCVAHGGIPPTNLNLASYSGDVVGTLTFQRFVRNVGKAAATYTASAAVPGFDVTVTPSTLTLGPREEGKFAVTVAAHGAAFDAWAQGALSWTDGTHVVHSPMALRPRSIGAPSVISETTGSGATKYRVSYGFDGATSSESGGKLATRTALTVGTETTGGGAAVCAAGGAGTVSYNVDVTASTIVARFATFDADTSGYGNGGDDLDLYVFDGSNALVGVSAGATAQEMVTLHRPAPGTYRACVLGYAPHGGASDFTLSTWAVNVGDGADQFKVTGLPSTVTLGSGAHAKATWSGVASGTRFLGATRYLQGAAPVGDTAIEISPDAPVGLSTSGASSRKTKAGFR